MLVFEEEAETGIVVAVAVISEVNDVAATLTSLTAPACVQSPFARRAHGEPRVP